MCMCEYLCSYKRLYKKYAFCAATEENGRQYVHVSLHSLQNTNEHVSHQNKIQAQSICHM